MQALSCASTGLRPAFLPRRPLVGRTRARPAGECLFDVTVLHYMALLCQLLHQWLGHEKGQRVCPTYGSIQDCLVAQCSAKGVRSVCQEKWCIASSGA